MAHVGPSLSLVSVASRVTQEGRDRAAGYRRGAAAAAPQRRDATQALAVGWLDYPNAVM